MSAKVSAETDPVEAMMAEATVAASDGAEGVEAQQASGA